MVVKWNSRAFQAGRRPLWRRPVLGPTPGRHAPIIGENQSAVTSGHDLTARAVTPAPIEQSRNVTELDHVT